MSATRRDLAEYRELACRVISRLGYECAAMEHYPSDPRRPLEKCLADVASSDIYIGLFAFRYGFVPEGETRSITELEYRTAHELGKPCYVFLVPDDASWPANMVDRGDDGDRIRDLREELKQNHVVSFFSTPAELEPQVSAALSNYRDGGIGPGAIGSPNRRRMPKSRVWEAYYNQLHQRFTSVEMEPLTMGRPAAGNANIPLPAVFVEPSVHTEANPHLRVALFDQLVAPEQRTTVLLADPGGGKSAVARYLALHLARAHEPRLAALDGYLPLLIELRLYAGPLRTGRCENFIDYLDYRHTSDGLGIPREELSLYLDNDGQAMVIFDGLDEIFDPGVRVQVARQIAAFAATYPQARILVTANTIGYSRRILGNAGFGHLTVEDFDDAQIGDFLRQWYERVLDDSNKAKILRRRMTTAIHGSTAMRELAGNPLLLSILAIIVGDEELPRERWQLYEHAASVLVDQWDSHRPYHNPANPPPLDGEDKMTLLRRLAYQMQSQHEGPDPAYIEREQLSRMFEDHIADRYGHPRGVARQIANDVIDQLHERNFILGSRGRNSYGFVHRTFLEFFCVQEMVHQIEQPGSDWTIARLRELFVRHWADSSWREVLLLLVGRVKPAVAAELITLLATEVNRPWPTDRFPEPPWNLALAAQCVAELRDPTLAAAAAEQVLRQIILLIEHCLAADGREVAATIEAQILPAVRVLGTKWPGRQIYLDWYRRRGVMISWENGSQFASRLAVLLAAPMDQMEEFIHNALDKVGDRRARLAIVAALAESASRSGVGEVAASPDRWARCCHLLEELGRDDPDPGVRIAAVRALLDHVRMDVHLSRFLAERIRPAEHPEMSLIAVTRLANRRNIEDEIWPLLIACARDAEDETVRAAAVAGLGRYHEADDEVRQLLVDRVRVDPSVSVLDEAARRLSDPRQRNTNLRNMLTKRAGGDPEEAIKRASIRLLGELFPDHETSELLQAQVRTAEDPTVRRAALLALCPLVQGTNALRALLLSRIDNDEAPTIRQTAQEALVIQFPDDDTTRQVLARSALRDPDLDVRRAAVRDLAMLAPNDATLGLLTRLALEDPSPSMCFAAAEALAERFPARSETRQVILAHAKARNTRIRLAAVRILITLDGATDVHDQLLDRVWHDTEPQIIRDSAAALMGWPAYQPKAIEALQARVHHDNAGIRRAVVQTLIESPIDPTELLSLLFTVMDGEPNPDLLEVAVDTIVERYHVADVKLGLQRSLYDRSADDNPQIRAAAIYLLGEHFGDEIQATDYIIERARRETVNEVRRAAVRVLAQRHADKPDVRTLLLELWTERDWTIRSTAIYALGARAADDPDIVARLQDMARNGPDRSLQRLAAHVLAGLPGTDPGQLPSV